MLVSVCRAKIHRARVTAADLHYQGSITIDSELLSAAGIGRWEEVQIVNLNSCLHRTILLLEAEVMLPQNM